MNLAFTQNISLMAFFKIMAQGMRLTVAKWKSDQKVRIPRQLGCGQHDASEEGIPPCPTPMAPYSGTLAWKILWTEEPGRLQSMGSRRVGHDWATSLSLFTFMHWRRKWQPTPVFLPGESQGWGSLVGCHLWARTESHMTEVTYLTLP